MGNLEEMDKIARNIYTTKTEIGRNRKLNRPITSKEIELAINQKSPKKQESRAR